MDIIIVDAVASVRLNLEAILKKQDDCAVVLSTGNIKEALDYLTRQSAALVIVDADSPKLPSSPSAGDANPALAPLSRREIEILNLLNQGQSYKSIADGLCLSYHTVQTHIKKIYGKLRVNSRSQAAYAFSHRLPRPILL